MYQRHEATRRSLVVLKSYLDPCLLSRLTSTVPFSSMVLGACLVWLVVFQLSRLQDRPHRRESRARRKTRPAPTADLHDAVYHSHLDSELTVATLEPPPFMSQNRR